MKLYNVSFNLNNTSNVLKPSVPDSAAPDEDKTCRRVCFTDSIEHCLQAIAVCNRDIRVGARIIVRTVEKKDMFLKYLVVPQTLFYKKLVPDAMENHEFWYLYPIKAETVEYEIEDFRAEVELAWSLIDVKKCREIVKKWLPDFQGERFKIAKNLYESAMKQCNEQKNWDAMDGIWDDLAELPWAQKRGIYDVKLKEIKRYA